MASTAMNHAEMHHREFSITPNFRSLSELMSSLGKAPIHPRQLNGVVISTAAGLKGARAAMVAIGLEAAAALFIYGIWQVWHIVR